MDSDFSKDDNYTPSISFFVMMEEAGVRGADTMKRLLLASALIAMSWAAWADPSLNASQLSCDKVQAAIKANGSVIVHYRSTSGSGAKLYARYVSDSRFCDSRLTIVFASVPTADQKACRVRKCASVY